MRRRGFPRYAPESLERKLSPSGNVGIPAPAEIYIPTTQAPDATATDTSALCPTGDPGCPDPLNPTDPGPDGDGNPPIPPSDPDGPDGPAN